MLILYCELTTFYFACLYFIGILYVSRYSLCLSISIIGTIYDAAFSKAAWLVRGNDLFARGFVFHTGDCVEKGLSRVTFDT